MVRSVRWSAHKAIDRDQLKKNKKTALIGSAFLISIVDHHTPYSSSIIPHSLIIYLHFAII